jgi:hypothetical protein
MKQAVLLNRRDGGYHRCYENITQNSDGQRVVALSIP